MDEKNVVAISYVIDVDSDDLKSYVAPVMGLPSVNEISSSSLDNSINYEYITKKPTCKQIQRNKD